MRGTRARFRCACCRRMGRRRRATSLKECSMASQSGTRRSARASMLRLGSWRTTRYDEFALISTTHEGVQVMPTRTAEAEWKGNLAEGEGRLKVGSGAFEGAY